MKGTAVRVELLDYYMVYTGKTYVCEDVKRQEKHIRCHQRSRQDSRSHLQGYQQHHTCLHIGERQGDRESAFKNTGSLFFAACFEVECIGNSAFENSKMSAVTIHEELVYIDDRALKGYTYTTTTNLRESSVTEIGSKIFTNSDLKIVDLRKIATVDPDVFKRSKLE